jgi:Phosphotransferase enzyme family
MQGARGIFFRVTLSSHGYTVVAKGTVPEFSEDLRHEAIVYRQLRPLQGLCVPICLGAVDLEHPYYYDFRVRVVQLLFLSWAGNRMDDDNLAEDVRCMWSQELVRSVDAIHQVGVLHGDIRVPNMLWSPEVERVMLIDFERSVVVGAPRRALIPKSPNPKSKWSSKRNIKRKRSSNENIKKKRSSNPEVDFGINNGKCRDYQHLIRIESSMAKGVF